MQLAHAGDERLTGLFVDRRLEGWILLAHLFERFGEFLLFVGGFRLDRHGNDRLREGNRFEKNRFFDVAERVAGYAEAKPDYPADIARGDRIDERTVIRLNAPELGHVLFLFGAGIQNARIRFERSGIDAYEVHVAVRMRLNFENERAEGIRIDEFARLLLFRIGGIDAFNGGQVVRSGEIIADAVHNGLNADAVEGRAAEDGHAHIGERRLTQHRANEIDGNFRFREQQFGQFVAEDREVVEQLFAIEFRLFLHFRLDFRFGIFFALRTGIEGKLLHGNEIDRTSKRAGHMRRTGADRDCDDDRLGVEALLDIVDDGVEIGALAVHLIDKGDSGNVVFIRLTPDGFALRFDALARAENDDAAVENAERAFDFRGEIDVSGRVDEIKDVSVPVESYARGVNGNSAFAFFRVKVGDRSSRVDHADLMNELRVEEHLLGNGRLARVDMGDNADISQFFQC